MNLKVERSDVIKFIPAMLVVAIGITYNFTRANNILIGALGTYMIFVGWPFTKFRLKRDFILLLLPILFFSFMIGILWADDKSEGWRQLEKRIGFLAFPLIFYFGRGVMERDDVTRLLHAFIASCFVISLVCYSNALLNIIHNNSLVVVGQNERNYYYFSYLPLTKPAAIDPIYLSLYVNFCIIILLLRPSARRWINYAALIYFFIFNLLIASKAGILINGVIFLLFILSFIRNKVVAVGVCVGVAIVLSVVIYKSDFLRERFIVSTAYQFDHPWAGDWNSTSQRLAIWACARETIQENFPFGYGTGNGNLALFQTYRERKYIRGYEDEYNAHNEFLFTWLDLGIFGTAVLAVVIVFPLIASIKMKERVYTYAIVSCLLFFLCRGCPDASIWYQFISWRVIKKQQLYMKICIRSAPDSLAK